MDTTTRGTARHRQTRRQAVERLAADQAGVLSHRQLYAAGLTPEEVDAEIRAGRWRPLGPRSVAVASSPEPLAAFWSALLEVGPAAALTGPSALIVAGLRTIDCRTVHVIVPKSASARAPANAVVHESRRFRTEDVLRTGIPRMRPATAAVHAALWLPSEKEAALFVVASVQQGLVSAQMFATAAAGVRKDPRRRFLEQLVAEVGSGVRAIGERDFARMCRRRGFPPPSRQVVRRTATGRVYLDVYWEEYKVAVEIDGIHHLDPRSVIADSLKQNAMTLAGVTLLRIAVSALRVDPEPFLDQVAAALRRGGWRGPMRPQESVL